VVLNFHRVAGSATSHKHRYHRSTFQCSRCHGTTGHLSDNISAARLHTARKVDFEMKQRNDFAIGGQPNFYMYVMFESGVLVTYVNLNL
jgi:hypothetical protein